MGGACLVSTRRATSPAAARMMIVAAARCSGKGKSLGDASEMLIQSTIMSIMGFPFRLESRSWFRTLREPGTGDRKGDSSMGFYKDHVIPRLIELCMKNKELAEQRAKVIPAAKGMVVELGMGSGLNLPFYGASVKRLYGVEPSTKLLEMARARADAVAFPVELVQQSAEQLPFDDESMDTVVVTWALCSIPEPQRGPRGARRVLRPGGQVL